MMGRKISKKGLELIKHFEGFSAKKYFCTAGVATIGYGHKILPGEKYESISKIEAEKLLLQDIKDAEKFVEASIKVPLTDNQFSAIVSFTFNLGGSALSGSTMRKKLNAESYSEAADELLRWVYSGGKKTPGLIRRREAERRVFLG